METIRQIIRTPRNHEIKITIPHYIPEDSPVEVLLIFKERRDDFERKINQLKMAVNDELFMKDLEEVASDFKAVDLEDWKES
ncbi:MAG: hypothetical protein ONB37_13335 [candidate division KSB1 bacterium]|nr:hypothetical protein [candidate division KSB1 bacterium]